MAGRGRRNRPTVDDLRTAFLRQAPNSRTWIREVSLDPLELIVSDDADGTTKRVPVTVSASGEISFGQPVRVRVEYVPADTSKVDASKLVYASAADSQAGHGIQVYATISSKKGTGAMAQPQQGSHRPVGPPRQPGEDVVSWALRTGRIGPDREQDWRREMADSPRVAASVLERLHPGTAVALTAAGRLNTVAASIPPRPAGADPRIFARNPLVDDMRAVPGSTVAAEAAQFGGSVPTLFPEGDLPHSTASGISPHVLASLPWYGRHPVAAAATTAEAEDLIDDLSSPNHLADEYRGHLGNQDYAARVSHWTMRGIEAAADNRRQVEAAQALQLQQVAAATPEPGELSDDEVYDRVFGDFDRQAAVRHLERLERIVAGGAVDAPMSQLEARAELERLARGGGTVRTREGTVPVPADAAQATLARLDRGARR